MARLQFLPRIDMLTNFLLKVLSFVVLQVTTTGFRDLGTGYENVSVAGEQIHQGNFAARLGIKLLMHFDKYDLLHLYVIGILTLIIVYDFLLVCCKTTFTDNLNHSKYLLLQVNNRSTRAKCEICSKLTIKHQNDAIGFFLVSLLLSLNIFHTLF